MSNLLRRFVRDERGVSAMEYAILAGIIVVALVAAGAGLTGHFEAMFNNLFNKVQNAAGN